MLDSLHTRYRPKQLKEVIGQDKVVRALDNVLVKKLSHAFLFVGPSGVGKTTLARICADRVDTPPNNLMEIDGATHTGIDDMRAVCNSVQYKPFGQGTKSVIIDESHALSAASWKALLKSLEDVQPWVYWFLCTTELNKIPETIRTRCSKFELKPVAEDELLKLITNIANLEKFKAAKSEEVLLACVKQANGAPRQAIVNLGICADFTDKKDVAELLRSAQESTEAVDLARALLNREKWPAVQAILRQLKEQNAESVRHVVRAFMTSTALNTKQGEIAKRAVEVLDSFDVPFPSGDGLSPVVLAVGRILLG